MPHPDFDAKKRERGAPQTDTAVLHGIYTDNDIIFHHAPSCKHFFPFSARGKAVLPPAAYFLPLLAKSMPPEAKPPLPPPPEHKKARLLRCVQLRKHSKAREKRYSFGYAVSFIFACYQILWTFPKSRYLCSRYLPLVCG